MQTHHEVDMNGNCGEFVVPVGKVLLQGARQSIDPCSLDACFHLNVLLQQGHALATSAESMGMNLPVGVGSYFSNSVREGCVSTAAWKHDYKWAQEIIDCGHLVRCSDSEVPVGAVNNLMLKPARRSSVARETGNVTYTETAHSDCWYKQVWRATYPCHVSGLTTGIVKVLPKRHSRQLHIELYAATLSYFQYLPILYGSMKAVKMRMTLISGIEPSNKPGQSPGCDLAAVSSLPLVDGVH